MSEVIDSGMFTVFDAIVVLLMLFSGLMAFARGFIREVASMAAFAGAIVAAFFAYFYLGPIAEQFTPDTWSHLISDGVVILLAFLTVYISAAWFGRKFSKFVHATTDITMIDRLAGLVFGIFRAWIVVVLILLVLHLLFGEVEMPWIVDSYSYPHFYSIILWIQSILPDIQQGVQDAIPDNLPDSR